MSAAVLAAAVTFFPAAATQGPVTPPPVVVAPSAPGQTGIGPSLYRGRFFRTRLEEYRKCIAQREGRFQYGVTGSNGRYESTYQMTDALVRGAAWEMTPELRDLFPAEWRRVRNRLLVTPGHLWGRFYMDMAFWTILNVRGDATGAKHWVGGRFSCRPGMASFGGAR